MEYFVGGRGKKEKKEGEGLRDGEGGWGVGWWVGLVVRKNERMKEGRKEERVSE